MRLTWFTLPVLILASGLLLAAANKDCSFLKDPGQFTSDVERSRKDRSDLTGKVAMYVSSALLGDQQQPTVRTLAAAAIPRKNFIDDAVFGRMATAGIQSAPLASDVEFLRRVTLDLTGRIPSGADVVRFVNDPNPSKRDLKVDALIGLPEFVDKWTMFLGDLYKNNASNNNVNRDVNGRDTFYLYLKDAVSTNKPYDQLARELISATGDSFAQGQVNWPDGNTIAMGPVQDTYDGHAVNLASMLLGIYVWEKFMVQAFVSPSNTFDLARLDPNNPPPAPWTLQPTNPQLLQTLAEWFQANRYDLRALMSLIAKSNAYQLSATYPGTWNISYVPYYARRYVRRLDAEELHDAIATATGIPGNYTIRGSALPPVQWAMQF